MKIGFFLLIVAGFFAIFAWLFSSSIFFFVALFGLVLAVLTLCSMKCYDIGYRSACEDVRRRQATREKMHARIRSAVIKDPPGPSYEADEKRTTPLPSVVEQFFNEQPDIFQ